VILDGKALIDQLAPDQAADFIPVTRATQLSATKQQKPKTPRKLL
jgi:hypothetical protein